MQTNAQPAPIGHNRPPKARKMFSRVCAECSTEYQTPYVHKLFCSTPCQKTAGNRDLKEGMRLVALGKAWRLGRNTSDPAKKAMASRAHAELCRLLDYSNADDRKAGRADAITLLRKRDALHLIDLP